MNLFAAVSLTVDFKNGADKQFGWKLFDCEANGIRCPRKSSVPKSLIRGFANPRREKLRFAGVIEPDHGSLRSGIFASARRPHQSGLRAKSAAQIRRPESRPDDCSIQCSYKIESLRRRAASTSL